MNPMYRYDMPYNQSNRFNDFNTSPSVGLTSSQIYNDNIYPDEYQENDFHSQTEGGFFQPNDPIQMRGIRMGINHMPMQYFKEKPMSEQNFGNERFSSPGMGSRDHSTESPYRGAGYNDNESRGPDFRERERERDRSQRRNRDDKRRSDRSDRNRDRERGDRGRDRDRSRDKDRGRDRDRYDHDSRSSSPSYYDNDNDRRHSRDDSSRMDRWMTETPSNTILVRGLPSHIDESPITKKVMASGISPKEVRLMRRNAGASRGFAFVEFMNVEDARQWMEINQGETTIIDNVVTLHYSTPRNAPSTNFQAARCDWICKKCGVHNFRRRDVCFKCGLSREESDRVKSGEGFDDVGLNPCNTLIFRGLDALTTEETLLHTISKHTLLPIKNICIMRDKLTSTSRGYAFAEMNSVRDASDLLEVLTAPSKPPFEVDGKQILVSFAKNTFTTVMATQNQYADQSENKYYPSGKSGSHYDYPGYNQQTTSSGAAASSVSVAQAAIQQAHAAQSSHELEASASVPSANWSNQPPAPTVTAPPTSEYPKYPPPDVSTYQYDESSGYYYDPLTNLYYDANTQYYYNSLTAQFMYWDAASSTYLPAPTDSQDANNANKEKDPDKKDKVKIAKKVAKDMEKWAKTLNTKKESKKVVNAPTAVVTTNISQASNQRESATADAGFAMFSKRAEDKKLMPPPPSFGSSIGQSTSPSRKDATKSLLVASYGGDSDEEEEEPEAPVPDESKLLDWSKQACLLCKRQFQSKEIMNKHIQFSDLHKQNLENWKRDNQPSHVTEQPHQYRDRAKERREKFGPGHPPEFRNKKQNLNMFAEPESKAPKSQPPKSLDGGMGSKLMNKMGWSSGQGLGRSNQGRLDIVTVSKRSSTAGLGSRGATYDVNATDTYQDGIKKLMQQRYNELS